MLAFIGPALAVTYSVREYCIRIRTRGGIYGKIWPEPEGLPDNNDLLSFLGLFMRKQLKDQCNTHISVISESESPLGHL